MVIVGTKTDLRRTSSQNKNDIGSHNDQGEVGFITTEEGKQLAKELNLPYAECSAKCDNESIQTLVQELIYHGYTSKHQGRRRSKSLRSCIVQ
jgi:GTPase SAR1 family protein